MKKIYVHPVIKSLVYDKDIMQLPIHNSLGNGKQLTKRRNWEEDEEEEIGNVSKSGWY
ncbi:MAG: hypothetical protein J5661_02825 [Bacteroidaceae bacterium]|nr:hypothetical protein [Bacteroidaceae bacterium]